MKKVRTSITIDAELKKQAEELFERLGIDFSTAITLFLSQSVYEQRIPFKIQKDIPNKTTIAALNEYEEMKNNPTKYKRYNSISEILK